MSIISVPTFFIDALALVPNNDDIDSLLLEDDSSVLSLKEQTECINYDDSYFLISSSHINIAGKLFTFYTPSADRFFERYVSKSSNQLPENSQGGTSYIVPCLLKGSLRQCVYKRTFCAPIDGTSHLEYVGANMLRKEAAILNALSKQPDAFEMQYIVQYIHSGVTVDRVPYILLERLDGGTLADTVPDVRGLESSKVVEYSKQLLFAVRYIGKLGIFHQDLKQNNVMFVDNTRKHLKIIDFDSASGHSGIAATYDECQQPKLEHSSGSINVKAPEYFMDDKNITTKSDLWSVGLLILQMTIGTNNHSVFIECIYDSNKINLLDQSFITCELDKIFSQYITPSYIESTIRGLLLVDSKARFSANQALQSLSRL
ncbi:hypothetical protein SOPP22_05525 [Shewanella sp. OPT22]|nr:hypothetical protein SOPP22_05525 [Shewanella sp. OPT22]